MEPEKSEENKKRKINPKILYFILIISVLLLMLYFALAPIVKIMNDPNAIKAYVEDRGLGGNQLYAGIVFLQTASGIIPGGPFQIAAGYLFGTIKGAFIFDGIATLTVSLTFLLAKRFGTKFIGLFLSEKRLQSLRALDEEGKLEPFIMLCIFIPGAPKDMLPYVAGLTRFDFRKWILLNFIGRFPTIILNTYGGEILGKKEYLLFLGVFVLLEVVTVAGSYYFKKKNRNIHI